MYAAFKAICVDNLSFLEKLLIKTVPNNFPSPINPKLRINIDDCWLLILAN